MSEYNIFNLSFSPILPPPILAIIITLIISIVFFTIINKLQGGRLRIIILLLFSSILIQPSLKIEKRNLENNILTFVIDNTISQQITERSLETLMIYENILKKLNADYNQFDILEIKISNEKITKRFGTISQILNDSISYEKKINEKKPLNLFEIFDEEINKYPFKKLSSVFFLTDGQFLGTEENILKDKLKIPVYFILPKEKKINDQKITINYAPDYAYVGEKVVLDVIANDYRKNQEKIDLHILKPDQSITKIKVSNNLEQKITFKINKPGENIFYISIPPRLGDISKSNNYKIVKINAIRKKLRVLLVSGEPYMGTRVWRNFLKADPTVELVHMTVLRPPEKNDNTKISELSLIPFPVKELFEEKLENFNLIIFDNFRGRNILTPLYYENLISFVETGGAILEITGPSYNSRESLFRTQVGRILPGIPTGKSIRGKFKPNLTNFGMKHPITKFLIDDQEKFGFWYEMNDVIIDEKNSSVLLKGLNEKPLLSIKKIKDGRIAQIYSHNIWLWKNNTSNPGPYSNLIKNLSHWLMKEPELEEDKLEISLEGNKLRISKIVFKANDKAQQNVFLFGPESLRKEIILNRSGPNTFSQEQEFFKEGYYVVTDKSLVRVIETPNFFTKEKENLNINKKNFDELSLTDSDTKVFMTNKKGKDINFKLVENSESDIADSKNFLIPRNKSYEVKEIDKINLYNIPLFLIIIVILLIICWKREGDKRA